MAQFETSEKPLLQVLRGQHAQRRPVWLMRQAGRYLPEYREVRAKAGSFLKLCYNPELASVVTLQPLQRFDLDAAILFSDILVVPHAMGLSLDFKDGEGPVLDVVADLAEVEGLSSSGLRKTFAPIYETVRAVAGQVGKRRALIGFCGGAWTVASYMIEGRSSDRSQAVSVAVENPRWFSRLMEKIIEASVEYLVGQVEAGAEALQVFDSWAGEIPVAARKRVIFEPTRLMIEGVRRQYPHVPIIVFARGLGPSHCDIAAYCKPQAVSVEQGVDLGQLSRCLPSGVALQGNLSPQALLLGKDELIAAAEAVLRQVPAGRHVFNLGHGIVPEVEPARVETLIETIRRFDGGV